MQFRRFFQYGSLWHCVLADNCDFKNQSMSRAQHSALSTQHSALSSFFSANEYIIDHRDSREHVRPPGVERQLSQHFRGLSLR
jgi:hypothetical protein